MTNHKNDEEELATLVLKTCYSGFNNSFNIIKLKSASPNVNWLVKNNDFAYVLRKCMLNNNRNYFNYLEKMIDLLNLYDIPVQRLIMDKNGQKEVFYKGNWWQLRSYIDGRPYKIGNIGDALESAKLLCKLHSIPVTNVKKKHFIHDPYYWLLDPSKEIENLDRFFKINRNCNNEVLKKYKFLLQDSLSYINIEQYNMLNRSIIHGDFHGNNLVFKNDGIIGLLDMDNLSVNARIIDVAESIYLIARKQRNAFELDKNVVIKYLEVYNNYLSLTKEEYNAMIPILILRLLPRSEYLYELSKKAPYLLDWQLEWSLNAASQVRIQLMMVLKRFR